MGQALRRAAGRLRTTNIDISPPPPPPPPTTSRFQNAIDHKPPPLPANTPTPTPTPLHIKDNVPSLDGSSEVNAERLDEQDDLGEGRDSNYEAMLGRMAGRISTKPGGKLEMGEAFVVRKSNRAMPKLRNTSPDTGRYEELPVAAGTLNIAQLRHILLMHKGKADGNDRPIGPKEIAESFRLDSAQVDKILQSVSMPAEDNAPQKRHQLDD